MSGFGVDKGKVGGVSIDDDDDDVERKVDWCITARPVPCKEGEEEEEEEEGEEGAMSSFENMEPYFRLSLNTGFIVIRY